MKTANPLFLPDPSAQQGSIHCGQPSLRQHPSPQLPCQQPVHRSKFDTEMDLALVRKHLPGPAEAWLSKRSWAGGMASPSGELSSWDSSATAVAVLSLSAPRTSTISMKGALSLHQPTSVVHFMPLHLELAAAFNVESPGHGHRHFKILYVNFDETATFIEPPPRVRAYIPCSWHP